ncbi:hypothetical protein L596_024038 [Steinernema carpocapsae]|uniref:Major facilitator superfamily (MFS) profile domain-containing protein n=1 Tax=Steinernema carpocapsae TaxID=34508 RepID=A0A4U5MFH8_STECR|nr:hypothetical protein L596_024038 [Steinernema carpocapsae]
MFPRWLVYVIFVHGVLSTSNTILEMMLNAVSLPLQAFFNESIYDHYGIVLDTQGMSLVVSMMPSLDLLGFFFSLLLAVPFMDSKGRRFVSVYVRVFSMILSSLAYVLAKYSNSIELYGVAQFLLGFVQPLKMIVVKIYLSECVPDRYRAFTALMVASCLIVPGFISTLLFLPSVFGNEESWQVVPKVCAGMEVLYLCLAAWLPESPKWLMDAEKPEEDVRKAIRFYHGEEENVAKVMRDIREEIDLGAHHRMSLWEVYQNETFRSIFKIIFAALLSSSLSMTCITQNYTQRLLLEYGYNVENSFLLTGVLQIALVPLLIVNPFLYERMGRRPLYLFSALCGIFQIFLLYGAQLITDINHGSNTVTFVLGTLSMVVNGIAGTTGLINAFIIFISDLLPPGAKVSVTQFVLLINLVVQIPAVFFFGNLLTLLGSWTFLPFLVLQILIFAYMFLYLPETKQLSVVSNIRRVEASLHHGSEESGKHEETTPLLTERKTYGT